MGSRYEAWRAGPPAAAARGAAAYEPVYEPGYEAAARGAEDGPRRRGSESAGAGANGSGNGSGNASASARGRSPEAGPGRLESQDSSESTLTAEGVHQGQALNFANRETGFDEEFQQLMHEIEPDLTIYKKAETFGKLSRLVRDFKHAALTYGKVIISEKHLPDELKSIQPVTQHVRGFAGGEKYIAGNIFFRLPQDGHRLYGGEALATKEANHQLKGVTALHSINAGLQLPLVAVIRYLGYKLVAMSLLPIEGEKTLCYGSSDGGTNLEDDALSGSALIETVATALNLAKHPVRVSQQWREQYPTAERWIHFPCDMEVHRIVRPRGVTTGDGDNEHGGEDVRHYVVDFARLFPPQPPRSILAALIENASGEASRANGPNPADAPGPQVGHHLVYMLRPELVRGFRTPLSSDAFSRFASRRPEHAHFEQDIVAASHLLAHEVIPRVARGLDAAAEGSALADGARTSEDVAQVGRRICGAMHASGVNLRFMGLVFRQAASRARKREILREAVARVMKDLLRGEMRMARAQDVVRTAILTPYLERVTHFLNLGFGAVPCQGAAPPGEGAPACSNCASWRQGDPLPCRCCCSAACLQERRRRESGGAGARADGPSAAAAAELANTQTRVNFWCHRLFGFLQEKFWFRGKEDLREALKALERGIVPLLTCHCCVCLWKRCLPPAVLFARVQSMCKIVLSTPMQQSCQAALDRALHAEPLSKTGTGTGTGTASCFALRMPFQPDSDLVDLGASLRSLPIMEYAQGTEALIRAKLYDMAGRVNEAVYTRERAVERLRAGLDICQWDPRLRCNLGMALEDQGCKREALQMYLSAIASNKQSARAWYLVARLVCQWADRVRDAEQRKAIAATCDDDMRAALGELAKDDSGRQVSYVEYCFDKACALSPANLDWKKEYANHLYHGRTRRVKKAAALYAEVLKHDSTHLLTLKNYSIMLQDEARKLRGHARKKASPQAAHRQLAKARELLEQAREHMRRAIELAPDDSLMRWRGVLINLDMIVYFMLDDEGAAIDRVLTVNEAIADLEKGFELATALREHSQALGDPVPRYFDDGDQSRAIIAASTLLCKVAKRLVVCRNVDGTANSLQLVETMRKCFAWGLRVVENGYEHSGDQQDFSKTLGRICKDNIQCLLNILDPGFQFAPARTGSPSPSTSVSSSPLTPFSGERGIDHAKIIAEVEAVFASLRKVPGLKDESQRLYAAYRAHFFADSQRDPLPSPGRR